MMYQTRLRSTSSSPSRSLTGKSQKSYQPVGLGLGVSKKLERQGITTGKFVSPCRKSLDAVQSKIPLPTPPMRRLLYQRKQEIMYGKRTPVLPVRNSNSDVCHFEEMNQPIGTRYGISQRLADSTIQASQLVYEFVVITPYEVSLQIMQRQRLWFEQLKCFGENLVLERPSGHGKKLVTELTLRVPWTSGGADIEVRKMLYGMNLEESLTSRISSPGWTIIRSVFLLKGAPFRLKSSTYGSPPTSPRRTGTQN